MFNKLLSNLPFNPSLIGKVSFYAKRLRAESSMRRLGFAFVALSLVIQTFAVIAPAEPTLAGDINNDILPRGFSSQGEAVNRCNANEANFQTILSHFGISCLSLYAGTVRTIDYSEYGGQLYSAGRLSYFSNDIPVNIQGAGTIYMRKLTNWGAHCYNDGAGCKAITGQRADGTPFMVLFSCGNPVIVGPPTTPPPPPPPPPPPTPTKALSCGNLITSFVNNSRIVSGTTVTVRGQAVSRNMNDDLVDMYYDVVKTGTTNVIDEDKALGVPIDDNSATDTFPRSFTLNEPGEYTFRLLVKSGNITGWASRMGDCVKKVTVEPPCQDSDGNDVTTCLIMAKKASNDTQKIEDANGTIAKAGDVITYTLSVTNTSKNTPVEGFVIKENISDILEYADVVDLYGGTKDDNNMVSWDPVDIQPDQTVVKRITVKVKNPIPNTPVAASNPNSFDMTMTNVFYGSTVNIKLPPNVIKTTEQVTKQLPNTGPGEAIGVSVVITVVAGYFFARSRLMAKELEIVTHEYATSGSQ